MLCYARRMRLVRKVIDSNYLRDKALADFLDRSHLHMAVVTEFVLLEAHKRDPLLTLPNSLAVLARYPRQIAVLRSSQELLGFSGRAHGLQRRLIDRRKSAGFPDFCCQVRDAASGNASARHAILAAAQIASRHIDKLVQVAPTVTDRFQADVERFTADELKVLRTGQPRSAAIQRKLLDIVFETTTDLARATGTIPRPFKPEDVVNLPAFRYCLCMMLLFVRWVEIGRQTNRGELIANDVIDANIAAYGTYFDGVLTSDRKLRSLHREAVHVLREIGADVAG